MWWVSDEVDKSLAVFPWAKVGSIKAFEPQRWLCGCGGYIYDPACSGGLAFEELGKKWKCPVCKGKKKHFRKTDKRSLS